MPNKYFRNRHPVLAIVAAPWIRLWDLEDAGKVAAFTLGVATAFVGDLSVYFMAVLFLTSLGDLWIGRAAARRRGDFDAEVSQWGFQTKIAGIAQVGIVRLIEFGLARTALPDSGGIGAVVIALALIIHDVESIDEKRQDMGARPIPILTHLLGLIRRSSEGLLSALGTSSDSGKGSSEAET